MTVGVAIYSKLKDPASATAALIGSGDSFRGFPMIAPQGTAFPYVVWTEVAATGAATHGEPVGTKLRLFQFSCFSETYESGLRLREAIISDLDGQTLGNGDSPTLEDERASMEDVCHRLDADFLV